MRVEFSAAVDPIFHAAIKLIEKIESGSACNAEQEHAAILALFDRAEVTLGASQSWQLAKYAVAVWIDEVLLTMPWEGAHWWRNHILEMQLFQSRICSVRFFELAKEASGMPCRDALEVFHNCVVLGFRGMYVEQVLDRSAGRNSEWPASIELWLDRTLRMIEVTPVLNEVDGPQRSIQGAPPICGRAQVVWWSVAALLLLLTNGAVYHFIYAGK